MGPYTLMLHCLSHKNAFRPRFQFLFHFIQFFIGPFFGQTPFTYVSHHIGMHHPENNLLADKSTTMPYQRDHAGHFCIYFVKFFCFGLWDVLVYLWRLKRKKLFWRAMMGEATYWLVFGSMAIYNPHATLVIFFIPYVVSRFAMMAGNWAQHAFLDADDPSNPFRNSLTCVETPYNRRCFNDGFHAGHHLSPSTHWSELEREFREKRTLYIRSGAVVLSGLDYFQVWFLLMFRRYETLASHCLFPMGSMEEKALELRRRTRRI